MIRRPLAPGNGEWNTGTTLPDLRPLAPNSTVDGPSAQMVGPRHGEETASARLSEEVWKLNTQLHSDGQE